MPTHLQTLDRRRFLRGTGHEVLLSRLVSAALAQTIHERPTASPQVRPRLRHVPEPGPQQGCTLPLARTCRIPCSEQTCELSLRTS